MNAKSSNINKDEKLVEGERLELGRLLLKKLEAYLSQPEFKLEARRYTIKARGKNRAVIEDIGRSAVAAADFLDRLSTNVLAKEALIVHNDYGLAAMHIDDDNPGMLRIVVLREDVDWFYGKQGLSIPLCRALISGECFDMGLRIANFPAIDMSHFLTDKEFRVGPSSGSAEQPDPSLDVESKGQVFYGTQGEGVC